jgi:outer membrane protein assembly factor BamB
MTFNARTPQHEREEFASAEMVRTRDAIQSLFLLQQRSPDEQFVQQLEHTLSLVSGEGRSSHSRGITGLFSATGQRRNLHLKSSTVLSAISVAALFLIISGIAAIIFVGGHRDGEQASLQSAGLGATAPGGTASSSVPGWELPLYMTDLRQFGGMTLFDGVIYRLVAAPGLSGVQAINALTGKEVWRATLPWSNAGITANADGVYYTFGADANGPSSVHALDLRTGAERWSMPTSASIRTISAEDSQLFIVDTVDLVTAIDTASGSQLWTGQAGSEQVASVEDGVAGVRTDIGIGERFVSVVSASGIIAAFDRQTGARLWTYADGFVDPLNYELAVWNPDDSPVGSSAPSPSSLLLIITLDRSQRVSEVQGAGTLTAIDADTGKAIWHRSMSTYARLDLTVSGDMAVFAANGFLDEAAPPATPAPAATPFGETVRGVETRNTLYGLDVRTGEKVWERSSPISFFLNVGTTSSGMIIGSMNQGPIVMVVPDDGEARCVLSDGTTDRSNSLPLVFNDLVIFMKFDGTLAALPLADSCRASTE